MKGDNFIVAQSLGDMPLQLPFNMQVYIPHMKALIFNHFYTGNQGHGSTLSVYQGLSKESFYYFKYHTHAIKGQRHYSKISFEPLDYQTIKVIKIGFTLPKIFHSYLLNSERVLRHEL